MNNDNTTNKRADLPELILCEVADLGVPSHESASPFCIKVHRALKAKKLPYTRRHGAVPDDFRTLNPAGQVPVLLVGGEPVFDSTKILARLAELAPGVAGPLSARDQAEALLWEELADTAINGFLVASRWADERNWPRLEQAFFGAIPAPARQDVAGRVRAQVVQGLVARDVWRHGAASCWERFERLLDQLEARAPEGGYWINERLTEADFAIFGQVHSFRLPLTPWQMEQVAARPRLSAYLDRVDQATR